MHIGIQLGLTLALLTGCSSDSFDTPDETVSTHRVDFEIMVPAYQPDALQVLLVIGDGRYNAIWTQDETWAVSVNLPSDAWIFPTVFFFDRNGEVLLAWTRDTSLQTNSGPIQTIQFPEFFSQSS